VAPGLDLLARVRAAIPDAYIAYKPHPDVEAGHRRGRLPESAVLRHANVVLNGRPIGQLLHWCDEVHTLTSLTGFEALLRGRPVTTYGQPFYAGWGLTTDLGAPTGRTRRLSVEALAAATLILYPHYIDPVTLLPCGPEQLLERLAAPPEPRSVLVRLRRAQGWLRQSFPTGSLPL
jgi:capsular polysaccharide export protein